MNNLLQNLKNFNAKERFFLIGEIIGNPELHPTSSYIKNISQQLGLNIDKIAFSAMDYHLDWLYACLEKTENPDAKIFNNHKKTILGQQEDIDFIIGYIEKDITHLILIEAKATTGWTNAQLKSKAERLAKIFGSDGKKWKNVAPHFIITSPKFPKKIKYTDWPAWMKVDDSICWLELKIPKNIQYVTRCDSSGNVTSEGEFWTIRTR